MLVAGAGHVLADPVRILLAHAGGQRSAVTLLVAQPVLAERDLTRAQGQVLVVPEIGARAQVDLGKVMTGDPLQAIVAQSGFAGEIAAGAGSECKPGQDDQALKNGAEHGVTSIVWCSYFPL